MMQRPLPILDRGRSLLARAFRDAARSLDEEVLKAPSRAPRRCPICGYAGPFRAFGHVAHPDRQCPQCDSLERHRLTRLMLDAGLLGPLGRTLHFAPEKCLQAVLRPRCSDYVTADRWRDGVRLRLDIERLDIEDASFDTVVAFHVLEHVDDRKALSELFRVLRPGGTAILSVPLVEGWDETYEAPEITAPEDRAIHFFQHDHLRIYGRDFRDRVRAAGFELREFGLGGAETVTYSLVPGERIFLAGKRGYPDG